MRETERLHIARRLGFAGHYEPGAPIAPCAVCGRACQSGAAYALPDGTYHGEPVCEPCKGWSRIAREAYA
jgi:MinD superfamily P-loop ATPase